MALKSLLLVTITLLRSGILLTAKIIATINHKDRVWLLLGALMALKSLLLVTITLLRSGILLNKLITTIQHKTRLAVAWSPDGSKIATASYDNTAQVWDLAQAKSSSLLLNIRTVSTLLLGALMALKSLLLVTITLLRSGILLTS